MDELDSLKQDPSFKDCNFTNVFPITLIEIDTLILYENEFIRGKLDLISLIGEYHQFVRFGKESTLSPEMIETHAMQSALSFSEFVRDYSHKHGMQIDFNIISEMLEEFGVE